MSPILPDSQIDTADSNMGLQFTNSFLTGEANVYLPPTSNGAAIVITSGFSSHVRFTNGVIWGVSPAVKVDGIGSVLLSGFTFNDSNVNLASVTGVGPNTGVGGTLLVRGCQFAKQTNHVRLGSNLAKALLVGNIATHPMATGFVVSGAAQNTLLANNI